MVPSCQLGINLQPVISENLALRELNLKLERDVGNLCRTLEQEKRTANEKVSVTCFSQTSIFSFLIRTLLNSTIAPLP
jgi:hypothetical protein